MKVSVILPVYNEADNIKTLAGLLEDLSTTIYEIIWVNDGSSDSTLEVVKNLGQHDPKHKYIDLSRNFGQQIALSAGLDNCQGDLVVLMDADGQDPPQMIDLLVQKIMQGFDVVYAKRTHREGESWWKKLSARLFYKVLNSWVPFDLPMDVGDFRIMNRKVVEAIKLMPERNKFLRGQIAWAGFKQTHITYHRPSRLAGQTAYPTHKMWKLAWNAITAFTDVPLKMISWLGTLVTFFSLAVMIYALYSRFILNDYVQGWTSLIIAVMFVGGIQMIAIGIIGSYMHRTHQNTLHRPLYFINEHNLDNPN